MGFVKLSNSLPEWAWYHDNNTLAVYIRLLMGAVWQDTGYQNVVLKRGQAAATIPKIAAQSGLTIQQTRTVLNRLKSTGKITVENTSKFSIITLIDYDCDFEINSRSSSPTTDGQHTNNRQSTDEQQAGNSPATDNQQSYFIKYRNTEDQKNRSTDIPAHEDGTEKYLPSPSGKVTAIHKPKPEKKQFGEFVSMTNEEYSSLVAKLGEQGAKRCIEILDNYKGANDKKYNSDYRAILNWVVERYKEEQAKQPKKKTAPSSFDAEEIMRQIHEHPPDAPSECADTQELIRQIREGKR